MDTWRASTAARRAGAWRCGGAAKFSFDKTRAELFRFRLKLLAQQIDLRHAKEVRARMLKDPGLSDNGAGGLDVDASKICDKIIIQALKETTGIQGLALPDKIDRETMNCARIISRRKA